MGNSKLKLATKLILFTVIGLVAILVVDTIMTVNRTIRESKREMAHDAEILGTALKSLMADVWDASGESRVATLIGDVNESQAVFQVQWISSDRVQDYKWPSNIDADHTLQELRSGRTAFASGDSSGEETEICAYIPVNLNSSKLGVLEVKQKTDRLDHVKQQTISRAIYLLIAMIIVGASAAGLLGIALVGRPLRLLVEKTRKAGTGDFDGPVVVHGNDELSELANAINEMCIAIKDSQDQTKEESARLLTAVEELRHADRLRTVGQLAAGIAHDLGTPLNVVVGRASLIRNSPEDYDEVSESAEIIISQGRRMTTTVRQLMDFARRSPLELIDTPAESLIQSAVSLVTPMAKNTEIEAELESGILLNCDALQIEQALVNLMINGIESMTESGVLRILLKKEETPNPISGLHAQYARIDIADQGPGIPECDLGKIFEPFFTTKDVGSGTGLGLSVAVGIIEEHNGWIELESEPSKGTTFKVYLPLKGMKCTNLS